MEQSIETPGMGSKQTAYLGGNVHMLCMLGKLKEMWVWLDTSGVTCGVDDVTSVMCVGSSL